MKKVFSIFDFVIGFFEDLLNIGQLANQSTV